MGGAAASRGRASRSVGGAAECRSCGLLLVADHSFYQSVGERSVRQTVLQVSIEKSHRKVKMPLVTRCFTTSVRAISCCGTRTTTGTATRTVWAFMSPGWVVGCGPFI